jgi:hypothetical protein
VGYGCGIRENKYAYKVLEGKSQEKRSNGISMLKWEYNIKTEPEDIRLDYVTKFMWFRIGTVSVLL